MISLAAACASSEGTATDAAALGAAHAQWTRSGTAAYEFTLRQEHNAFVFPAIRIQVEDGEVTSAVALEGPALSEEDLSHVPTPTIEEVFEQVQDAFRRGDEVDVEIDGALHYPISVSFNASRASYDGAVSLVLSDLRTR